MDIAKAESLPHGQLLIREMTHRVNNELASVISMVTRASRYCDGEAKRVLGDVVERLDHYVRIHRALQMPEPGILIDASEYFRRLCLSISRSKLSERNIRLMLIDCPLLLAAERCWLLGMIVNELITNATRHAFGPAGGKIWVEFSQEQGLARCVISDDGGAAADARPRNGLKIIGSLVDSLGGTFEQRFSARGSVAAVVFPVCR